ncbi:MAG TPA: response regulator [Rhizomicrobium sp.]|jgi:DNA-binding response OmpR family regulator
MKRRVIVADDDPTIISLVALRLGLARYDVMSAGDADAALEMARTTSPDVVILDVQMPCGGGLGALARLKADPDLCQLPVMMLTGERNAATVLQAMDGGADDYMVKPFNPDLLLERVSRLADRASRAPARPVWEI